MHQKDTEFKPNTKIIFYGWIGIILLLALGLEAVFGDRVDLNKKNN